MNTNLLLRGLFRTFEEIIILIVLFIANILPDLSIFSFIRSFILRSIASIGCRTRIRKNVYINGFRKVIIGKNCFLNRGIQFDSNCKVYVGNNVSIGFNTLITTTVHLERGKEKKDSNSVISDTVKIGDGVWIGANVTILPGSEIGDNCIIGAGAVVRGKLEPNGVYVGVPAKYIRETKGILPKII
jgi:acetyltransferase-like isoleucine patch superfamily enzyme